MPIAPRNPIIARRLHRVGDVKTTRGEGGKADGCTPKRKKSRKVRKTEREGDGGGRGVRTDNNRDWS